MISLLADGTRIGNPAVNISIFAAFVLITLVILVAREGREQVSAAVSIATP